MLDDLWSWGVIGIIITAAIGVGIGVMSMTPPEFIIAKASFSVAALLLLARLGPWLIQAITSWSVLERILISVMVFGLIGFSWAESVRWIQQRESQSAGIYPVPKTGNKPIAQIPLDYAYGLAFSGLQPSLDTGNSVNRLEIRLVLQNKVDGPLKFRVEKMVTTIADYEIATANKEATIAKGDSITIFPSGGLSGKQYLSLPARTTGTLDVVVLYGHPDSGFSRRAMLSLHLDVIRKNVKTKNETLALNWTIQKQSEELISDVTK